MKDVLYLVKIVLHHTRSVPYCARKVPYHTHVQCVRSVWEMYCCDKVVCFRVYTESQALFLHKKVHIVYKHTVSIIISVTKKYHTGCIVFNPLLHILNFEIFVLLIMHKNICHCKIIHKNHECNGFTLSFLFFYYWLLTLGCCQSQVIFLPPFHEMIICRSKKLHFVTVFVFMKFIRDL